MTFALSAIILIVLLLPGAVAINSYYSPLIVKQSRIGMPLNDLLFKGLIISFLLHSTAICILKFLLRKEIKFNFIYQLLAGKDLNITDSEFTISFLDFIFYILMLIACSFILGKGFKWVIRLQNWDINFYSLRTMNYWFLVFSGRYLEGTGIRGRQIDTDLVILDVLTKNNIIYSGILIDFNYSSAKDELENLILDNTYKRNFIQDEVEEFSNPGHSTGTPFSIPGDAFIIPAETIVNININYIEVSNLKQFIPAIG